MATFGFDTSDELFGNRIKDSKSAAWAFRTPVLLG
jgi:hypothetical protein